MKTPMLTLHGSYVRALNIIFKFGNLLLKFIKRHKFVLFIMLMRSKSLSNTSNRQTNDKRDLELANAISDRDELAGTPYKACHFNGAHRVF
jgi:hypothetical protein